jgi:hypothetical protein
VRISQLFAVKTHEVAVSRVIITLTVPDDEGFVEILDEPGWCRSTERLAFRQG